MSLFDDASLVLTPNGYKASKLYSIKPTSGAGDMVVVRATTIATRVNSAGVIESVAINVPRLDYPPLGGCPSILVEPERTNRIFYSEQFDNAYWSKYLATVTSNSQQAPDGNTTADLAYPSTTGALAGQLYKSVAGITSGDVVTVSVFVKASGKNFAYISPVYSFSPGAEFNLTTGAITNPIANVTTSMTAFANGWWRISLTSTSSSSSSNNVTIGSTDATNSTTNTVSGTNGILVWGAQIEVGSNATSYIPTTTAIGTRNADSIIKTGISSLIGQTEGTLFAEVIGTKEITANNKYICIIGGTKSIHIAFYSSLINVVSSPIDISVGFTPNVNYKIAVRYLNTGNFRVYVNGVKTHEVNTYVGGTFNNLGIGNTIAGSSQVNSSINSVQLYKTALTHEQCIDLTKIPL